MSQTESAGDVAQAMECMNPPLHPDATSGPLCVVLSPGSIKTWLIAQRMHRVCSSFYDTSDLLLITILMVSVQSYFIYKKSDKVKCLF